MIPFKQANESWQLSFKMIYKDIKYLEEFLDLIANSISISNLEPETSEINSDENSKKIWQIDAYFENEPNFEEIIIQINHIATEKDIKILDLTYQKLEDKDWVSIVQENFKPFIIGKFFITSKLFEQECPEDKIPIIINASSAFGTGEHETTKSCIQALEYLSKERFFNILDMGTGTGILSVVAAKIWPQAKIFGCDIEPLSVSITQQNADINNVINGEFFISEGYSNPILKDKKFDLIISNILATPLIELASYVPKFTIPRSYIIISGFLNIQAKEVINFYELQGFKIYKIIELESWTTAIMKRQ